MDFLHRKPTDFQQYSELKSPIILGRSLLKISSFSELKIQRKLPRFLGQKTTENHLYFWGKNLLKIASIFKAEIY